MAGTAAGIVNGAVTATAVIGAATVTIAVIGQSGAMIVAGATIVGIIEAAAATWAAAEEATSRRFRREHARRFPGAAFFIVSTFYVGFRKDS
jgi:hypothetical protein